MTGAIEFLQHAREMCINNNSNCKQCPLNCRIDTETVLQTENLADRMLLIENMVNDVGWCLWAKFYRNIITDKEIADLVREVERWWKENE